MILIFTIKYDYSSTCVVRWLNHLGIKVVRINGDDEIYKFDCITNCGIFFRNTLTNETINLKEAKACWWRRTGITKQHFNKKTEGHGNFKDGMDVSFLFNDRSGYINDEYLALKDYIFYSIYESCQINLGRPLFNLNRLIVIDIAKKHGIMVPEYEVVENGRQFSESRERIGPAVTKAISNGIYEQVENHRFYTYTELAEEEFYENNKNSTFFPSLITGLVEKKLEIRSFYIDGHFFSMAIFSQSSEKTKIDFRKYGDNRNEPYKLPDEIEKKLRNVFNELELNCGSVDLIVDKNGNYVFLEINPVGQFGMTSEPCNYDLEQKVVKYLKNGTI